MATALAFTCCQQPEPLCGLQYTLAASWPEAGPSAGAANNSPQQSTPNSCNGGPITTAAAYALWVSAQNLDTQEQQNLGRQLLLLMSQRGTPAS